MGLVLLFPGQGLQHAAMLPWLDHAPEAAPLLRQMAEHIGGDWRQRLSDSRWSERNDVAQSLITGTGLAAWQVLHARGMPLPAACAGYSVGEIAAFSVAGVYDAATAMHLAQVRAQAMDACARGQEGGLLYVHATPDICLPGRWAAADLEVAIDLGPGRCVLGGADAALQNVAQALAAQGAQTTRLHVRVASHTARMLPAAQVIAAEIERMAWQPPLCALVTNCQGVALRSVAKLKQDLAAQVAQTVLWRQSLQTLIERRPACVLEMGAGSALSRGWLAVCSAAPARSIDEFASAEAAVDWVRACLRT